MGQITTVNFRGDTLLAFQGEDGVYIALRPISDRLGLDWSGQLQRIKRDTILSEGMVMIPTPFGRGGPQETVGLRLDLFNGWLFGIDENRVKDDETRELVLLYKRECHQTLFNHFFGARKPASEVIAPPEDTRENESLSLRKVHEARQVFGNQAAAQLWVKLGLDVVPAMLQEQRQMNLFTYTAVKAAPDRSAEAEDAA